MKKLFKTLMVIAIVLGATNIAIPSGLAIWSAAGGGEVPKVVISALGSLNKFGSNAKVRKFKEQMGGTALGVCHPKDDAYTVALLDDANIGWVRFDIHSGSPYVIDEHGRAIKENGEYQLNPSYVAYKNRCKIYKDAGYKVMGITPYPDDMLEELGELDVFNVGGEFSEDFCNFMKEVSAFYATDLQGYVDCFQISNELTIDKWQGALTTDQVCYYQGELQMKVMYPILSQVGVPIGFNLCGYTLYDYPKQMCDEYGKYFDYIGLDLYLGCFESSYHTTAIYDLLLHHLYNLSGCKPIMINEFGYISAGIPKTDEERAAYLLETYGEAYASEELIKADVLGFLTKFKEVNGLTNGSPMTREAERLIAANGGVNNPDALKAAGDYLFNKEQIAHIYKALPDGYELTNYEHNEDGQAAFYKDTISRLSNYDFVCGYFLYCFADSDECYQCGQAGCPVETGWGLVGLKKLPEGVTNYSEQYVRLKPSFYAVQEVFGKIKEKEAKKYNK